MPDKGRQETRERFALPPRKDGWRKIEPLLTPFRPPGCDASKLAANEARLEAERVKHAKTLISYILRQGCTIHPNATPGLEDIFGLDSPYEAKKIAFPKHIMTANPDEDIRNRQLSLRRDIPILYFLSGFAHEFTHLDRSKKPAVARVMQKMVEERYLEPENVGVELNANGRITPDTMEEEAATDVQAYFLLRKLGIKVEPENYCTCVGRGKLYEQIVYDRIKAKLSR